VLHVLPATCAVVHALHGPAPGGSTAVEASSDTCTQRLTKSDDLSLDARLLSHQTHQRLAKRSTDVNWHGLS
jgi:hypothetical protein